MILVTTGTTGPPFDRLLRELDGIAGGEELVVQHGPSSIRPRGAVCVDYVTFASLVELVRRARIVVTHAGVGSVLVSFMNGKRPIVLPRLARFGEAVDDHQLELARRLAQQGLVVHIDNARNLRDVIDSGVLAQPNAIPLDGRSEGLVIDLRRYIFSVVGAAPAAQHAL